MNDTASTAFRPGCLLVDDREENLFAHEALLRGTGADIRKARSGDEALELLLRHEFAVAVIDVQMPGMDGIELAETMRGIERTRHVPIIFVTAAGHDEAKVLRGYASGGAVDFLYKPLSPQIVQSKVRVFLELARQRRTLELDLGRIERALEAADSSRHATSKAHELRDHLLAIAGHDLRTPLSAIMLSARLIMEDRADHPDIAPRVERIVRSAERIADIVEEMVEVSRAQQTGGFPIERVDADLVELGRAVVAEIEVVHPDRAIEIRAPSALTGRWDPRALTQALSNLVINAVVHGATSPVELAMTRDGNVAVVEIHNDGEPIPNALLPHIFEPFRSGTPQPGSRGLGLGLYIANEIVRAHGGTLVARSSRDHGTSFTMRLPRQ